LGVDVAADEVGDHGVDAARGDQLADGPVVARNAAHEQEEAGDVGVLGLDLALLPRRGALLVVRAQKCQTFVLVVVAALVVHRRICLGRPRTASAVRRTPATRDRQQTRILSFYSNKKCPGFKPRE